MHSNAAAEAQRKDPRKPTSRNGSKANRAFLCTMFLIGSCTLSSNVEAGFPPKILRDVKNFSVSVHRKGNFGTPCTGPSIREGIHASILVAHNEVFPEGASKVEIINGSNRVRRLRPDTLGVDVEIKMARFGPDGKSHYAAAYDVQLYRHIGDEDEFLSGVAQIQPFQIQLLSSRDKNGLCADLISSVRRFLEHRVLRSAVVGGRRRPKHEEGGPGSIRID